MNYDLGAIEQVSTDYQFSKFQDQELIDCLRHSNINFSAIIIEIAKEPDSAKRDELIMKLGSTLALEYDTWCSGIYNDYLDSQGGDNE